MHPSGCERQFTGEGKDNRILCLHEYRWCWDRYRNSVWLIFNTWNDTGYQTDACLTRVRSGILILQSTQWGGYPQHPYCSFTSSGLWQYGLTRAWLSEFTSNIILDGILFIILCNKTRIRTRILVWSQGIKTVIVDWGAVLAPSKYFLQEWEQGSFHLHTCNI